MADLFESNWSQLKTLYGRWMETENTIRCCTLKIQKDICPEAPTAGATGAGPSSNIKQGNVTN